MVSVAWCPFDFLICPTEPCYVVVLDDIFLDNLRICQFFAIVTLVLYVVCCLTAALLIKSDSDMADDDNNWPLFAFLSCIAAATAVLMLTVVWYITIHNTTKSTVGYSFKLTAVSGLCIFSGGLMAFFTSA
ncbi:hypothetical protein Btru_013264 [Bulinus truncatus]|nr:hypothetical protein Btru_013264 [Bulinus truncatus]